MLKKNPERETRRERRKELMALLEGAGKRQTDCIKRDGCVLRYQCHEAGCDYYCAQTRSVHYTMTQHKTIK